MEKTVIDNTRRLLHRTLCFVTKNTRWLSLDLIIKYLNFYSNYSLLIMLFIKVPHKFATACNANLNLTSAVYNFTGFVSTILTIVS